MAKFKPVSMVILLVCILGVVIWLIAPRDQVQEGDMLHHNGTSYHYTGYTLKRVALGSQVGLVNEKVDTFPGRVASGQWYATAHRNGTAIQELRDYLPAFRLGVRVGGKVYVYESMFRQDAAVAQELLDIQGKVIKLKITGDSADVTINDAAVLESLAQMISVGHVDYQKANAIMLSSAWKRSYLLTFYLKDKTTVQRQYYSSDNVLMPGIQLNDEFKALFYQELLHDN